MYRTIFMLIKSIDEQYHNLTLRFDSGPTRSSKSAANLYVSLFVLIGLASLNTSSQHKHTHWLNIRKRSKMPRNFNKLAACFANCINLWPYSSFVFSYSQRLFINTTRCSQNGVSQNKSRCNETTTITNNETLYCCSALAVSVSFVDLVNRLANREHQFCLLFLAHFTKPSATQKLTKDARRLRFNITPLTNQYLCQVAKPHKRESPTNTHSRKPTRKNPFRVLRRRYIFLLSN